MTNTWEGKRARLWQVARALHPLLSVDRGEWELTETQAGWAQFRRDEFGFYLRVGQGDLSARLVIAASFGGGIDAHHDGYNERWPQITLSWDRSPEEVCREVERRLLPKCADLFARLLEKHRGKNLREFEKDAAARQLQAASGGLLWHEATAKGYHPGQRDHRIGRRGYYDSGEVPYGVAGTLDHSTVDGRLCVKLQLDLSPDDACAVLRLLAARHDDDTDLTPAPAADDEEIYAQAD